MSHEAYELAALTMRYVFTALMLLIVWRACRGALIDSRRAAKLRQLSPMTGVCGELVALEADERLRRGMRFPVIREGAIGSARRSDVRIRHSSVRRRHAFFQMADDGLHVRSHAGARLRDGDGRPVRELTLTDGDELTVGRVRLLLVLSVPDAPRRAYTHREEERRTVQRADDFRFPDDDFDFPADSGDPDFPADERRTARRMDDTSMNERKTARRTGDSGDFDFSADERRPSRRTDDTSMNERRTARRTGDSGGFDFPADGRRPSGAGRRPARGLDDDFDTDPDDLFDVGDDPF